MKYIEEFQKQSQIKGENVAIKSYDKELSFLKLLEYSKAYALELQEKFLQEKALALCSDGSIEHFIGMLACLQAGIPFINIDVKTPAGYLESIAEELDLEYYLSRNENPNLMFSKLKRASIDLSLIKPIEKELKAVSNPTLYYVATSGTTGVPKLVCKTEEALLFSKRQIELSVPKLKGSIIQQYSNLCFAFGLDLSLILLLLGNQLCIEEKQEYVNFELMCKRIDENKAKVVFWPASIIKLLSKQGKLFSFLPPSLEILVAGGEPLMVSANFVFEMKKRNLQLLNNYGCTEVGTIAFSPMNIPLYEVEAVNRVALEKPLPGFEILLLDEEKKKSQKGDIYILSKRFPNSYYHPEKHEKKIVSLEAYPNKYLFNMGDIGEIVDGKYYILGRNNNCVNVKGYRVEIENVEYYISKLLAGAEVCVFPMENSLQETRLYCYLKDIEQTTEKLREDLEEYLPEYMIPTIFLFTEEFIHSKNGKLDRRAMKQKYLEEQENINLIKKRKDILGRLQEILEEMLQVSFNGEIQKIPFKHLGLDSLGLVDYISVVEDRLQVRLEESIVEKQVIYDLESLAKYIEK